MKVNIKPINTTAKVIANITVFRIIFTSKIGKKFFPSPSKELPIPNFALGLVIRLNSATKKLMVKTPTNILIIVPTGFE